MKNKEISISWVSKRLGVSSDWIKKWIKLFGEYLSPEAVVRGETKTFTVHDIQVLAVINDSHDWEDDDGDYSDIHSAMNEGLPSEPHYQLLAHLNFPVFQEIPERIDENSIYGALIGGEGPTDKLWLAQSFKLSADLLVDTSIKNEVAYHTIYPILYNYRHSIELYLKVISGSDEWIHNLNNLLRLVEKKHGQKVGLWVNEFISQLHDIDKESMTFRYGEDLLEISEKWVDLKHLKSVVGFLCSEIEKLHHKR